MVNSPVETSDPVRDRLILAMLRGHLQLLALGMRNSQLSGSAILAKAMFYTKKAYKRGAYAEAITDINEILGYNK
jgi:hypothetical protein